MFHPLTEVAVANLPWPWNPFKCTWEERFRDLEERHKPETDGERTGLFGEVALGLTPEERLQCPYHTSDWKLAAELAVALHRNRNDPLVAGFEEHARARGAGAGELRAILSFWTVPMSWSSGSPTVGNGQHRTCALKLAGAETALVLA